MKRLHIISLAVGLVLGLALHVSPAEAGPRPTSDLALFTALNGKHTRELNQTNSLIGNADGGGLSLVSIDAGPGCNLVATGAVYEGHCATAGHFCPWGSDGGTGGSFCSTSIGSPSYGRPVNASSPNAPAPFWFITAPDLTNATTNVCIIPKLGDSTMTCALFRMQ